MNQQSKQLHGNTKEYFNKVVSSLQDMEDNAVSVDDMIDNVYSIRESMKYLEQVEKELRKLSAALEEATFCVLATRGKKSQATEYCTATCKPTNHYPIPSMKKDPEQYLEFMSAIGIPKAAILRELVRPHWPGVMELCTELNNEGREMLPGVEKDKMSTVLGLTIRGKKEI